MTFLPWWGYLMCAVLAAGVMLFKGWVEEKWREDPQWPFGRKRP